MNKSGISCLSTLCILYKLRYSTAGLREVDSMPAIQTFSSKMCLLKCMKFFIFRILQLWHNVPAIVNSVCTNVKFWHYCACHSSTLKVVTCQQMFILIVNCHIIVPSVVNIHHKWECMGSCTGNFFCISQLKFH
jgi:hypothetical protein